MPDNVSLYDGEVTLKDAHEHATETLTATQILEQSSNIGVYKIALRVGKERLLAWIQALRLRRARPASTSRARTAGYVLPGKDWFGSGITNVPIGQGVRRHAHPAHARLRRHRQRGPPGEAAPASKGDGGVERRDHDAATARKVDRMLRKVVSDQGTGELANVKGYAVAGKTGTAEKIDPS